MTEDTTPESMTDRNEVPYSSEEFINFLNYARTMRHLLDEAYSFSRFDGGATKNEWYVELDAEWQRLTEPFICFMLKTDILHVVEEMLERFEEDPIRKWVTMQLDKSRDAAECAGHA